MRPRAAASGAAVLVACAAGFGVAREGTTSPAAVRLGVAGASSAHASVAADGARVVVTWAATAPGGASDVFAAFSSDAGASFGAPVRVNDVAGDARASGEQAPRVGLADGVRVVWVARRDGLSMLRGAKAKPGETVFTPAATLHADKLTGARGWASLALDDRGAMHVAWLDGRGDGAPPPSAGEASGRAKPARAAMRQDVYQAVWRPDGSRDETRIATDVCFCCKTSVAAGPGGAVYVAFRNIYKPNLRDVTLARSTDGGRTFGAPVRVSEDRWAIDGCPDDGPAVAVDARGVVHVVWPTLVSESEGKGVFYSYSTDGGRTFAPRLRLDGGADGAAHPQMASAGDQLMVAWDQARGDGTRAIVVRAIGASSGPPRLGAPSTFGTDATYPSVAATADGAVVTWTERAADGSDIRVQRVP